MTKVQVQAAAYRLKAFLNFNKFLRDNREIMVTYSMPYDEPSHLEAETECVKQLMSNVKLVPLEESDELLQQFRQDKDYSLIKECFDSLKEMIERCKVDAKFLEIMTRASLLCLLYEQIGVLIDSHYGHVIDPLIALENKLYAAKPVDRNEFAMKIVETMEFYRTPKVKWSEEKESTYTMMFLLKDAQGIFDCHDFYELKEKVPSLDFTNDSSAIKYLESEYGGPLTADMFKALFNTAGFLRAVELDRFYCLLGQLADHWMGEQICMALKEEDKLYTLPPTWLHTFMDNLEEKLLHEQEEDFDE